ncbi:MAG: RIP metalloprotease RseP [Myxococcales bacterium]|nr:RIP metalloprotease RseP [Myxococcales bacterium]
MGIERPDAIVGSVERGSPAAEAGLAPGDRIAAIDGEAVRWWSEVEEAVRGNPGDRISLEVERGEERFPVSLAIGSRRGVDTFRTPADVGFLGLRHHRQKPVVGVPEADSPAAQLGFRSGDRVQTVAGEPVEDWGAFATRVRNATGPVPIALERGPADAPERIALTLPGGVPLESQGLIPAVVLVAEVAPDSAASEAGVQAGDLIVAVDGEPVGSFFTFQETVLGSEGRALEVSIARTGEALVLPVAPRLMETDVGGTKQDAYRIGIHGENAVLAGTFALDQTRNPLIALGRGVVQTGEITVLFLRGLKKLITGDISRKNIGGPIEIARQSHSALRDGWDRFMNVLILISINIGILNLLPIPMLDGGQAVVYTVEGLKRGPLSHRTRLFVQQVGVVFLLGIMGFAFWNDISRNWSSFFEWFRNLVA